MKIALVHEWFDTYSGSERVVEQLLQCFPGADIFAVVDFMKPGKRGFLEGIPVQTSFIQRLPFAARFFRLYLGLMPFAIEQFDLSDYDIIISSSHAVAKGVITGPDQLHVSYVHSPMRYAWDLQHQYLRQANLVRGLKSLYARWLLSRLRMWDVRTAFGVDVFVANSTYIARRIKKTYHREAEVIHPPVDVDAFNFCEEKSNYYLTVSRLVPYKRVDLIAEAFAAMPSKRLIIVGEGPENRRVSQIVKGKTNITLLPAQKFPELVKLMQSARSCVFAAEEDFGITTVEAQACGTPVISFGRGGARDILVTGGFAPTGVMFEEQSATAIIAAVEAFEAMSTPILPASCRANAMRFTIGAFRARITALVESARRVPARETLRPAGPYELEALQSEPEVVMLSA